MIIPRLYACVDEDGFICQTKRRMEEDEGPNRPPFGQFIFHLLTEPLDWSLPTDTLRYKWVGGGPHLVETATLSDLKARKCAEITKAKINANMDSFLFGGKKIAVDDASFREMQSTNGFVALNNEMPSGWPGGWKAVDNTYVIIADAAAWRTFYNTMVQAGLSNFNKSQALKLVLENATTAEQIQAVEWE